jgi:hypothetical protein
MALAQIEHALRNIVGSSDGAPYALTTNAQGGMILKTFERGKTPCPRGYEGGNRARRLETQSIGEMSLVRASNPVDLCSAAQAKEANMSRASYLSVPGWLNFGASLLAALVLLGATTAQAKDFCIDTTEFGGNPEFIALSFKLPKAGKCRAFVGHRFADFDGGAGAQGFTAIQGVACAPSSGDRVNFTLTVGEAIFGGGSIDFYTVALSFPALQGNWFRRNPGDANGVGGNASGSECALKVL